MRTIQMGSIFHMPWLEYRHALPDGRVCIRLRTGRDDFEKVTLKVTDNYAYPTFFEHAHCFDMAIAFRDELFDYYEVNFNPHDPRLRYLFCLYSNAITIKLDAEGLHMGEHYPEDPSKAFAFAYVYPAKPAPEWTQGCVGYQIFPDRFRRVGGSEEGLEPWESDRVQNEFRYGGNLKGIIEAVPYLKSLGVSLIYMTPIFLSDTSHRYNTFDYYQIDPLLGTKEELKILSDTLHENDMRIVMDGVFNHSGLEFAPFVDAKEKGEESKYRDWFYFDDTEECGYRTFGHWPYMPKLDMRNKDCTNYFLDVGRYWLEECNIDGWRMDVRPEVYPAFCQKFREMMTEVNLDSLLIAECWDDSRQWLTQGDMFDSTMCYVLSRNMWDCFCFHKLDAKRFDYAVNSALMLYPKRTQEVLWTFLGTHDTARVRTKAGGDLRMLHAASFFQFTYPGIPIIYYGDELGMEGGEDPYCRFPMRWDNVKNNPTHAHFQKLAMLRKENTALSKGSFKTYKVDGGLYAYMREDEQQQLLCVLNTSLEPIRTYMILPEGLAEMATVMDLYSEQYISVENSAVLISLEVGQGMILCAESN